MDMKTLANDLMSPARAAARGFPHDLWTRLRADNPVAWLEPDGIAPFWAITKHADIKEIATQPEIFKNAPRPLIGAHATEQDLVSANNPVRMLIQMDPPEHKEYRKIAHSWFIPKNLKRLEDRVRASAHELVDRMAAPETWDGDFVTDIAAIHPARLITHILGIPEKDEPYVIRLANVTFGSEDPEFQPGGGSREAFYQQMIEALNFFHDIKNARMKHPTEDLASAIVHATINDEPIGYAETIGYFLILLTAGHETTRTAMAGGLLAMMENREELQKLKEHPDLVECAVDEMVRWTSPVNQFARTAVVDYTLRDATIQAGQSVCLFFGSANRDAEVFDDPFAFRVDRTPNPHLGFGIGEHFCLGASMARMEIRIFFEELMARLDIDSLESTAPPKYLASNFVGGVKHLPIRCKVT